MESKTEWEKEFDALMEFKELFERQTRHSVAIEIRGFIDKSREAGRSEHFLSGLEAAYGVVVGPEGLPNVTLYDERQELLF